MNQLVIDISDIGSYAEFPILSQFIYIKSSVQFMISRNCNHLFEVFGSPIPERMFHQSVIAEIANISRKNKYVTDGFH